MPAPIVVFAFNRPEYLQRTLLALASNNLAPQSDLTIFCDGPRHTQEQVLTDQVGAIATSATGFRSLRVVERKENLGCANSVIAGCTEMFAHHDRLVVIEDDIICSPHTLSFLNTCLDVYEASPVVFNISAWSPPPRLSPIPGSYPFDAYFVPRFNCWGWATWRDRWEKIDWEVSDYKVFSQNIYLQKAYNQGGEDLSNMLKLQMQGAINSWAIRMDYARFKHGCVGLNPVRSYTTNIGIGSGTHTTIATTRWDNDINLVIENPRLSKHVFVDPHILRANQKAYIPLPAPIRIINKLWCIAFG